VDVAQQQYDGIADIWFEYGAPGDLALVGDWNGDGIPTPGVARTVLDTPASPRPPHDPRDKPNHHRHVNPEPVDFSWLVRNANETAPAESGFAFGHSGDYPLVWGMEAQESFSPDAVDAALVDLLTEELMER
jgi:hypothetical protein